MPFEQLEMPTHRAIQDRRLISDLSLFVTGSDTKGLICEWISETLTQECCRSYTKKKSSVQIKGI